MKFYSLASSSSGNCYLYDFGKVKIMIDVGLSRSKIKAKLNEINLDFSDIDAIFITHEHSDHVKGLEIIAKNENVDFYLSEGTLNNLKKPIYDANVIKKYDQIVFDNVVVESIPTSHDAEESLSFILHEDKKQYVHILDTGYIINDVKTKIANSYFYLLESNYDEETLLVNPKYPYSVKKRILSDKGHLSNNQCNQYLQELVGNKTQYICFGHLSEQNNAKKLVEVINNNIPNNKIILDKDETIELICK